jgi:L-threonylcarbamoyladenylate synthase
MAASMTVTLRLDRAAPATALIRQAAQTIRDGGIVAYPTDTLYGLAVDPRNTAAVQRLYTVKGRPEASALTLIAADRAQARLAARFTNVAESLARRWWPGPLTIVLMASDVLSPASLAGGRTVGVRVPDDEIATALARESGFCITATSANRSGEPPPASAGTIAQTLPGVDVVLDAGPAPGGPPSTIVGAFDKDVTLIREGAVPWEQVLRAR